MTTLQLLYDDHDNWGYSAILWQQWANKYHYNDNDYNLLQLILYSIKNLVKKIEFMQV